MYYNSFEIHKAHLPTDKTHEQMFNDLLFSSRILNKKYDPLFTFHAVT